MVVGRRGSAVRVRAARQDDAGDIAKILLDAPQFAGTLDQDDLPGLVQRAEAALNSDTERQTLLVAELDGAVVGYAHVHWVSALFLPGPEGYVTELFVGRSARGHGCGSALLDQIHAIALGRKAARLFLVNGRQSEAYVRGFYSARGYSEANHLASFRRDLLPSLVRPAADALDPRASDDGSRRRHP